MIIYINENARLEITAEKHAKLLYDALNNNRQHLSVFLPWIEDMQSEDDFASYIKNL